METTTVAAQALDDLARVTHTLKRLAANDWHRTGADELLAIIQAAETASRRMYTVHIALADQLDTLGIAKHHGCSSTAVMIRQLCRVSAGESNARVRVAKAVRHTIQPTGAVTEPALPQLAYALAEGLIGPESANIVERFIHRLPGQLDQTSKHMAEDAIVEQATMGDANDVRNAAQELQIRLDPDGKLPIDRRARMTLRLGARDNWGMTPIKGHLDDETIERLRQALEAMAAPKPAHDGIPDQRSAANRRACALAEILQIFLNTGTAPTHAGSRPNVTVFITLDDLENRANTHTSETGPGARGGETHCCNQEHCPGGHITITPDSTANTSVSNTESTPNTSGPRNTPPGTAISRAHTKSRCNATRFAALLHTTTPPMTAMGGAVSPETARRICCDANITPVVLGGKGEILDVGRTRYSFPTAIRRALEARDRGCAMPGCDRPTAWTAAHHIKPWSHGGTTALSNGVLLCDHHHHLIHHSDWEVQLADDGTPEFLPPTWIDWQRKPRRNHRYNTRQEADKT